MRAVSQIIILVIAIFTSMASAQAQTPREQLNQMVEQLQKTPTDNALREKIIKLAQTVKPAPAIPEEANRAFVRGNVFQKEAKDASGYELAITAYRDALRAAPWWGDAYFNLGIALELAQKFDEAIASIKLYTFSLTAGTVESREAQNRIYAIEAKREIAAKQSQSAIVAQAKSFEGDWHREERGGNGTRTHYILSIKRGATDVWSFEGNEYSKEGNNLRDIQLAGSELRFKYDKSAQLHGGGFETTANFQAAATVTPDGNTLRIASTRLPFTPSQAAFWPGMSWLPKSSVDEYKR